jgi:hypothetical protein
MRVWSEGHERRDACPNCGFSPEQARAEVERQSLVAALLRERAGLEQKGDTDGVAAVDAQLRHYGHEAEPAPQTKRLRGRAA